MEDILTNSLNIKLSDFKTHFEKYTMRAEKEAGRHNFIRKLILPLTAILAFLSLLYFIILLVDGIENMIFFIFAIMNIVIFMVFFKKAEPQDFLRERVKAYIRLTEMYKESTIVDLQLCEVKTYPRVAYGLQVKIQDSKGNETTEVIWQKCLSDFSSCESSNVKTTTIDMENSLIIFPCQAL